MYSLLQIISADGLTSLTINELTSSPVYPVKKFDWDYEEEGDQLPHMESSGQWDNWINTRRMLIDCEGTIVCTTTTAYWTARKNLAKVVVAKQGVQTVRRHSRILMSLDGDGTIYYADVNLDDWSLPIEANYPTVGPFKFQWTCNFGYWRNLSSNAAVIL